MFSKNDRFVFENKHFFKTQFLNKILSRFSKKWKRSIPVHKYMVILLQLIYLTTDDSPQIQLFYHFFSYFALILNITPRMLKMLKYILHVVEWVV